jgi:hypothetical protein
MRRLDFKGRRRDIWGRSYTELYFLDEPTALAAGHWPRFERRRKDAEAFAENGLEVRRLSRPPCAAERDDALHTERLRGRAKRLHRHNIDELPDGAFAAFDGAAFGIHGGTDSLTLLNACCIPGTTAGPETGREVAQSRPRDSTRAAP